jgi:hypothetical protein
MGVKFWAFGEREDSRNSVGDDYRNQNLFFQEVVIQ